MVSMVEPLTRRSRSTEDVASSVSAPISDVVLPVDPTCDHVKPMAAVPLDAKHAAMAARASSAMISEEGKVSSGGAWMEMDGTGIAARESVMVYGSDSMPRKLVTFRSISKVRPPSSSVPPSSAVTEEPTVASLVVISA